MQIDKIIIWILILILPILIISGSSINTALDKNFYNSQKFQYTKQTIDYFNGNAPILDIPNLNGNELSHMNDVKLFSNNLRNFYVYLLVIYTVLTILLFVFSTDILENVAMFLYAGGVFANMIFLLFILLVLTSFDSIFWKFHEIFFSQGNFAFPADSMIKQLFPDSMFVAGFQQIMISSFIVGLIVLLSGLALKYFKQRIYKSLE